MAVRDELDIPLPAMAPSYRPSVRRRDEMDPATKRLAIFAGVIGTALLGLVAVWSFTGHHRGGVPVIEADSRPVKVKPANPGGMQVQGANDSILSGETDGKETVAPGPETPAPQALKAQEEAATPPPPVVAAQNPSSGGGQPAAPPDPAVAAQPEPTQPLPPLRPHPATTAAAPAAPRAATPVRLIPGARPAGPVALADSTPRVAARTPLPAKPAPAPAHPTIVAQALPAPGAATATRSAPLVPPHVAAAATASTPAAAPGHRTFVQFAAVNSGDAALREWERLAKKYPDLFNGRAPNITKAEHDGKTFWRIRTGGFADLTQATVFCQRAKAKGAACSVAAS